MIVRTLMMSAATAALFAGSLHAQDTGNAQTEAPAAEAQTDDGMSGGAMEGAGAQLSQMTAGDVIGMEVLDPEGATIGEIDYVIDRPDGPAGVIGIGGFLGLGEYTVALPLERFDMNAAGTAFMLDTDKETLKSEPEFDETGVESVPGDTLIADLMDDAPQSGGDATMDGDMSDEAETDGAESQGDMSDGNETQDGMSGNGETGDTDAEGEMSDGAETGDTEGEMSTEGDSNAGGMNEGEDGAANAETGSDTGAESEGNAEGETGTDGGSDGGEGDAENAETEEEETQGN